MKKLILFLLLPLWAMAQTSTGQEQEFDYGIKNNSTQTITTPPYLGTFGTDGTQGKIPSAYVEKTDNKQNSLAVDGTGTKYPTVDAVNNGVILTNSTPQTKVGGFTSGGVNMTYTSDKWIALGTSVTLLNSYTRPMSLQLNVILSNYGVSGSTSNDLINHYSEIPTLTADNEKEYRLLSIEHGINDASQSVPLATFRANLEACIANAKGKGWTNKKILIINGNYCSRTDLIISQPAYASEAILIAKEQGVQYVDIYNYTKNNGGGSLLGDTVHPTIEGGKVYARGVVASMQGGGEFTNALSVVNGVNIGGNVVIGKDTSIAGTTHSTGSITTLESIKTGYGTLNTPANTVTGDIIVPIFAGIITQHAQAGLIAKFTPIEDFGGGVFGPTIRNYVENGHISMYTAGTVRGSQRLAFRVNSNGVVETPFGINSASNVFTSEDFRLGFTKSLSYVGEYTNKITATNALGSVVLSSGFSGGTIDFNVSNGVTNASNLAFRINNNRSLSIPLVPTTSAGAYDILTRNTSTGVVEKITSASIAPLASPDFTGTPTAPTAPVGTNTTQIATTAFVQAVNADNVKLTGNQSITGLKTFSNTVTAVGISSTGSGNPALTVGSVNGDGIYSNLTTSNGFTYKGLNNGETTFSVDKFGKIIARVIQLKNYTVATLPAGTRGDTAYVTDATAPTYLGTLTGGGTVVTPVFYNGSAWVAH